MSDPVLRAQHCPDSLLPPGAKSFLRHAADNGWDAHATVAVGPPEIDSLAVMSVYVWARKKRPDGTLEQLNAGWECPSDRSKPFGFRSAWHTPGPWGLPSQLNLTEARAALAG